MSHMIRSIALLLMLCNSALALAEQPITSTTSDNAVPPQVLAQPIRVTVGPARLNVPPLGVKTQTSFISTPWGVLL